MVELSDMQLLVRAVAAGSLSAAGRALGLSPAAASKRLARLEAALGVRLLQRSTRRLSLTDEGAAYHARCVAILADVADAEAAATARRGEPRGTLRVAAPVDLGRQWVAPLAAEYAARHGQLQLRLALSDRVVDLLEDRIDVAVRIGPLPDSRFVSRRLARGRRVVCAAPAYLRRRGPVRGLDDLMHHDCLGLLRPGMTPLAWTFQATGGAREVPVRTRLAAESGEVVRDWAVAGFGLAFKSIWDVAADISAGRLVPLLAEVATPASDIHAVHPSRQLVPARTRDFIEALQERFAAAEGEVMRAAEPPELTRVRSRR